MVLDRNAGTEHNEINTVNNIIKQISLRKYKKEASVFHRLSMNEFVMSAQKCLNLKR